MIDFPMMMACVIALVGGGIFAWREQNPRGENYADHRQAVTVLGFVAALILFSCLIDLGL